VLVITWADGSLQLDCEVSSQHESTSETTEHAVEQGASVADHVRPNADTCTLVAMVSNHPLRGGSVRPLKLSIEGRNVSVNVLQFDTVTDRVGEADAELQRLQQRSELLTIETSLRRYENVVITRYSVDRDASTAHALSLILEIKRLRLVSSQLVSVPDPVQRRGRPSRNRGAQPTTEATGARRSVLSQGLTALQGLFQ